MKKVISILCVLALVFAFCGCKKQPEEKDLLSEIKERGYIVIATEGDWAPWTYHDENDKLTGFDVELGKLVAKKLGVEARFEETLWDSILAGIDSGRFDIACNGVGYSEDRAKKYDFSTPYVYMGTVLVVAEGNSDITCFEDLNGKTTANTASSTYAIMAEGYGATVVPVDNLADTINLLIRGDIDGTLNAAGSIADYLNEHPDAPIKVVATSSTDIEKDCIPVVKGEKTKTLLEAINKALEELRADGTLSKLSIKYFGADYTKEVK